jgi:mono/diheme cytochrome c family protein
MGSLTLRALILTAALPLAGAGAQEHPAKRLSSIVSVATEEYSKAVDRTGKLISDLEFQEAVDFLADAKLVAARLSGERAAATRLLLDSLAGAVAARRPPDEVVALHARFTTALGTEGALDLPARVPDLAQGKALYAANCSSCHGPTGMGDGPAAVGMNPPPPAVGNREMMIGVSPALMYRITSVGITGTSMPAFAGTLTTEQRWNVVGYVTSLRATPAQVLEGEGLYLQRCAGCHGMSGEGDGPQAPALTRLPPELGSTAWQMERSDARMAEIIRLGVPGSAMPPHPGAAPRTATKACRPTFTAVSAPVSSRSPPPTPAAAS